MASVMQPGRGIRLALFHAAVLVLALLSLMEVTDAVQWVAGGEVQKWSFLHANDAPTFFNDWANDNKTFQTGDTLLFEYDNATHSVLQVAEADFAACNVTAPINAWYTGSDSVFISEAGTFYYICGAPVLCSQGMKVAITASGVPVPPTTPPLFDLPSPAAPAAPTASHAAAAPVAILSCTLSLFLASSLAAILWW